MSCTVRTREGYTGHSVIPLDCAGVLRTILCAWFMGAISSHDLLRQLFCARSNLSDPGTIYQAPVTGIEGGKL